MPYFFYSSKREIGTANYKRYPHFKFRRMKVSQRVSFDKANAKEIRSGASLDDRRREVKIECRFCCGG